MANAREAKARGLVPSFAVVVVVVEALISARQAAANPWPSEKSTNPTPVYSLEWLLSSPMEFHSHAELPVIREAKPLSK